MYKCVESIFIVKDEYNGIKETTVSKNIGKVGLIISLGKGGNDRNVFRVERIFDIDMKAIRSHEMQAFPITTSDRAREVLDNRENIIRKLHVIKNICIYAAVQFL